MSNIPLPPDLLRSAYGSLLNGWRRRTVRVGFVQGMPGVDKKNLICSFPWRDDLPGR